MMRIVSTLLIAAVALATTLPARPASFAASESGCFESGLNKPDTNPMSSVATAQQPAAVTVNSGPDVASSSPALQLTLKPKSADPQSPFMMQVFARNLCQNAAPGPGDLLGVVSFYGGKLDKAEEFVLTPPEQGFPSVAPGDVQVTVKLISANPARMLTNAAVEIVRANFAK